MKTVVISILLIGLSFVSHSQIHEGKIVFERKTNLFKKYTERQTQDYIKEENKYRIEEFTLYFNDTLSVFVPEETFVRDRLTWTTNSNTVIQNFAKDETQTIYSFSGASVYVKDSLFKREWKLTDKWRTICNLECMQAVYELNDSTRIFAWFTSAITPEIGPESYCQLPGAILGLANEDGSITYFAKSIQEMKVDMDEIMPRFNDKKATSRQALIEKTKKDYKFEKDLDAYLLELFMW